MHHDVHKMKWTGLVLQNVCNIWWNLYFTSFKYKILMFLWYKITTHCSHMQTHVLFPWLNVQLRLSFLKIDSFITAFKLQTTGLIKLETKIRLRHLRHQYSWFYIQHHIGRMCWRWPGKDQGFLCSSTGTGLRTGTSYMISSGCCPDPNSPGTNTLCGTLHHPALKYPQSVFFFWVV